MPGSRYEGWHHTRFEGDVEAGKALLPLARKVLGYAHQQASVRGLGTYKHVHRLPGGGLITAEKVGDIPRVTVSVPPGGAGRPHQYLRDDFVVWARDDEHPEGIDPDHPQQILRAAWRTYFFSTSVAGYEDFTRDKGTYIGAFPQGVDRAGNVDWRGADGQRLNWYGPATRYWMEPYVNPADQYGTQVFQLGQEVVDLWAYNAALAPDSNDPGFDEWWVLGAAKRGLWLYVVHTVAYRLQTEPADYPFNEGVIIDPVQPDLTAEVVLSRFRLDNTNPVFQTVLGDSRQELWREELPFPYQPWFFDPDAQRAVCHALPAAVTFAPPAFPITDVAAYHRRWALELDEGGESATFTTRDVSLTAGEGDEAAIAEDGEHAVRIRRVSRPYLPVDPPQMIRCADLVVGDAAYPLYEPRWRNGGLETGFVTRLVLYVDARTGVAVFLRNADWFLAGVNEPADVAVEVWRDGALLVTEPLPRNPADLSTDAAYYAMGLRPDMDNAADSCINELLVWDTISPLLALYGVLLQVYREEGGVVYFFPVLRAGHAGYKLLSRPAAHWWGGYKPARRFGAPLDSPDPMLLVADMARPGPQNRQLDDDGMHCVLGCASNEEHALLSLSLPVEPGALTAPYAIHFITDGTLPDLTGVAGENARYHPIWQLGTMPAGDAP